MSTNTTQYSLEIKNQGKGLENFPLCDGLSIGSSQKSDLIFSDAALSPIECRFRFHDKILSMHYTGEKGSGKIEKHLLIPGKMYMLDTGDKLELGGLQVYIRQDSKQQLSTSPNLTSDSLTPLELETTPAEKLALAQEKSTQEESTQGAIPLKEVLEQTSSSRNIQDNFQEDLKTRIMIKNDLTKRPSFFSRLLPKEKSKAKDYKRPSQVATTPPPGPGSLVRLVALLAEFSLTYSIVYTLLPLMEKENQILTEFSSKIREQVLLMIPSELPVDIASIVNRLGPEGFKFLSIYIIFHITFNLLLGASLPLSLMGVGTIGSISTSRIKALLRSLIAPFTLPFIILDLPALLGKPTFKELITHSRMIYKSSVMKLVGFLVIIPLLILSGPLSPLILHWHELQGLQISHERPFKIKRQNEKNKKNFSEFSNSFFGFSGQLPSNILIFPYFSSIKKTNQEHQWLQGINLVKVGKKSTALKWLKINSIDFPKILKHLSFGNPLLKITHPSLYTSLDSNKNLAYDRLMTEQVFHFITASLELSKEDAINGLLKLGPFVAGPLKMKTELLSELNLDYSQPLTGAHLKFKGKSFLKLSNKRKSFYIEKDLPSPMIMEFRYKDVSGKRLMDFIENKVLRRTRFRKISKSAFMKKERFDAFDIIDFFTYLATNRMTKDEVLRSQKMMIHYFQKMDITIESNKVARRSLKSSLRQTVKALKSHSSNPPEGFTTTLKALNDLMLSMKEKAD